MASSAPFRLGFNPAAFYGGGGFSEISRVSVPQTVLNLFYNSLPLLVLSSGFWDQYSDYLQSQTLNRYVGGIESFDFIIVGGGSAGSVLANRLSANPNYQVLLLENGGNPNPMQAVPGYFGAMVHIPQIDYDYYTVPQKNACLALKEQRSFWPRGRGLGGSSNLNAMFYQRGNPNDFDKWAELSGSDEWKFNNILRNFRNIEDYHGQYYDEKLHSQNNGGVYVSVSTEEHLYREFLEAGKEMGYPTKDVNGRQEASFSRLDVTIKNGRRFGAFPAFIEPIQDRKNLHIYRYSKVIRVELDDNRRATGVTYIRHGVERFVKANREVILSAGSIDTPKLLMLSGIGPRRHLENLGIKCKVNLPVGRNLQDHIMSNIPFTLETRGKSFNLGRDVSFNVLSQYINNHEGLLSTPMLHNGVAYVYSELAKERMKSENLSSSQVAPDIQLLLLPTAPALAQQLEKSTNFKTGYVNSFFEKIGKYLEDGFFVNVMLAKYYSRGEVKLSSANVNDKPVLSPRYFSHPDDIRILIDGLNFTVNMVENSKAFQKYGAKLVHTHLPGCEEFHLKTREYYECYARHWTLTVYHHCGTCSMGKGVKDPKAVVDPQLRVINTKSLRVVDASIIPEIPNANINSITFMIGDKASEMILEYWRRKEEEISL